MEKPLTGRLEGKCLEAASERLRSGGVAVLPTDTVYGFHCVYSDRVQIERITSLKGRPRSAGFILLASSIEMAETLVSGWPAGTRRTLDSLWPAPLTAILPATGQVPPPLRPGGGVALRIPALPGLLKIIELVGEPLVSTSVNRTGQPPLNRMSSILREFPGLDAYITRTTAGRRTPSTIIDLTGARAEVVRPGSLEEKAREAFDI